MRENLLMRTYRDAAGAKVEARLAGVFEVFPRPKERVRHLAGTMSEGEQAMLSIAHRGYVLSRGRVVAAGNVDHLRENPEVRAAYFGRQ